MLAADVRNDDVLTHGWERSSGMTLSALLDEIRELPLAGILVTAVHVEGTLGGPDLDLVRRAADGTPHPLIASGGIASLDDLRGLAASGAMAAVIGMALYTGALDAARAAAEFGEPTAAFSYPRNP